MTHAVGTDGNFGLPGRGPICGKRFFPLDSLLWWGWVGEGCTSHLVPGLRPSR